MSGRLGDQDDLHELGRLLLEDVCSDLVRFHHSRGDPTRFGAVHIDREYALGAPGTFAELRVEPADEPPYFVEVKYAYPARTIVAHLARKYGAYTPPMAGASRVVLVVDMAAYPDWPNVEADFFAALAPELSLEVWDGVHVRALIEACFGQAIPALAGPELISVRERIDQGKERLAFGDAPAEGYAEAGLRQSLLWHFGTWRLRELRHVRGVVGSAELVPPGVYEQIVVLMADLSGFSRYVRDTPDASIVRRSLTNFYAKARYQVINAGGMLAQFVGDEVVALFGIPDRRPGYIEAAVRTAFRLLDIGESVSHDWQRRIDNVQPRRGVHIGMAMGSVQTVAMRACDHARIAAIGDCLDLAARLVGVADQGQIVISNMLRHALSDAGADVTPLEPFEARNIGLLQPWRLLSTPAEASPTPSPAALVSPSLKSSTRD